jgi:hypothetical protein
LPRCTISISSTASDDDGRRDLDEGRLQCRIAFRTQVRILLTQRCDLARFEIGLGDDLAVHLHQDLFDDVGARRRDCHNVP